MKTSSGFPARKPRTYAQIEREAAAVRNVLKLPSSRPLRCLQLFERLDEFAIQANGRSYGLTYGVEDLPPGVEARVQHEEGRNVIAVVLSPQSYAELRVERPRARFSVCHEIGHGILHTAELVQLAQLPDSRAALLRGKPQEVPAYKSTEWQANAFAAALLMPAEGLAELEEEAGDLTPALVMERYHVSALAAELRIRVFRERRWQLLS